MCTLFSYESPGERILKINPHLPKLLSNIKRLSFFLEHGIHITDDERRIGSATVAGSPSAARSLSWSVAVRARCAAVVSSQFASRCS